MPTPAQHNRVRERRLALGMTQADLAERAGISRTAVTAIEGERLVPSVAAALALAEVLECSVEALFGRPNADASADVWAWQPPAGSTHCWKAEIQGRTICYPSDTAPMWTPLPDRQSHRVTHQPTETLVIACCDPAAGLLASHYAAITGLRLLVISRSSRQSLELLRLGQVHLAGLHLASDDVPGRNAEVAGETLGSNFQLVRIAHWQEGIAVTPTSRLRSVSAAQRARLTWVGREPGSGARQCLDRLLGDKPTPLREARHHRGVTEAIRSGWADAGVCVELTSAEAGLDFLPVQREAYDVCIPESLADDRRVKGFLKVVRSKAYRRLLSQLQGYDTSETGIVTGYQAGQ